MGFVDDENLIAVARGTEADALAQLAHFVDAAIGRRVDLDDVHRRAAGNFEATGALAAGRGRGSLFAVQTARKNAGDRGLAGAALAGKNIAVGDALLGDGVFERGLDVFLADELVKCLRPVLARDDLIHGKRLRICQTPGDPRHTGLTATVASFRTWRGLRPPIARSPEPDKFYRSITAAL